MVGKEGSVYAGKMLDLIGQRKALHWMGQGPEISRARNERGEIQRQWHENHVMVKWWCLEGSQKPGRAASRSEQWVRSGLSFCHWKYHSSTLKSELGLGYTYKYSKQDSQIFLRDFTGEKPGTINRKLHVINFCSNKY